MQSFFPPDPASRDQGTLFSSLDRCDPEEFYFFPPPLGSTLFRFPNEEGQANVLVQIVA